MESPGLIVQISDLVISYSTPRGELRAVDDVNLSIRRGEAIGIVGESGSGKTTLALGLLGMNYPGRVARGSVRVDSIDILSLKGEAIRRYRWEKTAMIFQSAMNALDPVKTIESQMVETILQHKKMRRQEARERIERLLELVHLDPSRAKSYPHELSGGMRQRVVIALALCLNPQILVADEPTTALDVVVQAGILRTIRDIQLKLGLTVVLISHDISIMSEVCDRIAVMYAGKIVEIGPTGQIIDSPAHPYTEALLKAIPVIGSGNREIQGIPGYPPNLTSPPSGCRFRPRCLHAFEKCVEDPPLFKVGENYSACWLRSP